MRLKHQQFPEPGPVEKLKVKKLIDFDGIFASTSTVLKMPKIIIPRPAAKPFLKSITRPTLLINALDDPFLSESCFPTKAATENLFSLMMPPYGGHVGFVSKGNYYWSEQQILRFLEGY